MFASSGLVRQSSPTSLPDEGNIGDQFDELDVGCDIPESRSSRGDPEVNLAGRFFNMGDLIELKSVTRCLNHTYTCSLFLELAPKVRLVSQFTFVKSKGAQLTPNALQSTEVGYIPNTGQLLTWLSQISSIFL
jgi:hypothetical protein